MILTRVRLDFSDARWAVAKGSSEGVRKMFERVTARGESKMESGERMSLGALLYLALIGEGAQG
jgi:hypothetical protein